MKAPSRMIFEAPASLSLLGAATCASEMAASLSPEFQLVLRYMMREVVVSPVSKEKAACADCRRWHAEEIVKAWQDAPWPGPASTSPPEAVHSCAGGKVEGVSRMIAPWITRDDVPSPSADDSAAVWRSRLRAVGEDITTVERQLVALIESWPPRQLDPNYRHVCDALPYLYELKRDLALRAEHEEQQAKAVASAG